MAARRCSLCGISYPDNYRFQKCPVHGEATDYFNNVDPDENWEWLATAVQRGIALNAQDDELIPTLHDVAVTTSGGQLFISSHDVIRAGIRHRLQPLELVRIGQQVFEIQGYIDATRDYWVRSFSMELSEADLRRLADGEL